MSHISNLISLHELIPHPEGGYYKETYRSQYSTGIFYLLTKGHKSSFHRISSDEMWHFYGGDAIIIVEISKEGILKETRLDKENVQYVVEANLWFGAYLPDDAEYAFTGCSVSPAFEFNNFELASKEKMLKDYPHAKAMIEKLLTDS